VGSLRNRRLLAVLLVLVLGLAACGGDDDESAGQETTAQATTGPGAPTTVPDAGSAQLAEAAEQFADQGLRVAVEYSPSGEPAGSVIGQVVPAGTELQRGDTVELTVSTGPNPPADVAVPDVIGQTRADAQAALERAGFDVQAIDVPAVEDDQVIYHTPAAGPRVPRGSLVILYAGG
jgi:eukaryotic-like serine/threonine-protein kinase